MPQKTRRGIVRSRAARAGNGAPVPGVARLCWLKLVQQPKPEGTFSCAAHWERSREKMPVHKEVKCG